jgi:succinyl-diaminopimelate desuccinylase
MSRTLELTKELIRRRSVTPDDAGCQRLIADRLQSAGFSVEHMRYGDVDNLWAIHRGGEGPVACFAGHTDVVPSGPREKWSSDPFEPVVRDGQLYGRGAADMKSGVAAMVTAAREDVAARPSYPGSIAFVITSDEEGPSVDGTRRVVEALRSRGQRIAHCIVGEPSSPQEFGVPLRLSGRLDEGSLSRFWGALNQPIRPAFHAWTTVPIVSSQYTPFRRVEERVLNYERLGLKGGEKERGPEGRLDMPPKGDFHKRTQ